jgi:hypothetical protein
VFPLQDKVPVWGTSIENLECANHICKCLRSNLEKLVIGKPHYKGKGKLTKITRLRLKTAVRCAIRMRSRDHSVKQLRKDIINSVNHVLGFHDRCVGASVAEWLRSLTSNHLPLTAVGSNPDRDFGFFHERKLSS